MFDVNVKVELVIPPAFIEALNNLAGAFSAKDVSVGYKSGPRKSGALPRDVEKRESTRTVTLEQLRALIVEKGRAAAKALLSEFDVAKLTDLDQDQYGDFYKRLEAE